MKVDLIPLIQRHLERPSPKAFIFVSVIGTLVPNREAFTEEELILFDSLQRMVMQQMAPVNDVPLERISFTMDSITNTFNVRKIKKSRRPK